MARLKSSEVDFNGVMHGRQMKSLSRTGYVGKSWRSIFTWKRDKNQVLRRDNSERASPTSTEYGGQASIFSVQLWASWCFPSISRVSSALILYLIQSDMFPYLEMRRFSYFGKVWSVLATVIISIASTASSADWQLGSSDEDIFDLNAPAGQDWTISADSFQEGGDAIASNSGIINQPSFDDITPSNNMDNDKDLFMNDDDNDNLQIGEFWLTDADSNTKGEECSSSDLSKKIRRQGHAMCSTGTTGILHTMPAGAVRDAGSFDLLHCPITSILIKSLFVCSSPDPFETIPAFPFYTLLESTRGKRPFSLIFINHHFLRCSMFFHTRYIKRESNMILEKTKEKQKPVPRKSPKSA